MIFFLIIITSLIENPRILHDSLVIDKHYFPDTALTLRLSGEKLLSISGTNAEADIFQSSHITLSGKTKNGWIVEGLLYDSKLKPTEDIYTIGISDLNTAYLVIHRKNDSFVLGRFNLYEKGIDGGLLKYTHGPLKVKIGGGKTRGTSATFDTIIHPPYNVPIRITLNNIDYFTIVKGTERVFFNGKRASKKEYTIDYERCIITFNPIDQPVELNVLIEFEYHSAFETPFIHTTELTYNDKTFKGGIKWFSENIFTKYQYTTHGGIFLPEGGGDYQLNDSFFVYVGNGKGHYRVFFKVDTINGSYIYDERGFYVYVGNKMGNYSPIILKNPPPLRDVKEVEFKIGSKVYTEFKYIHSINKTTGTKGTESKVAGGIELNNFNLKLGLQKTEGEPLLISSYFDLSKNTYTYLPTSEKFITMRTKINNWKSELHLTYDTIPNWHLSFSPLQFYCFARGKRKLEDMQLGYKTKKYLIALFKTYPKTKGLFINAQLIPSISIFWLVTQDSLKLWHYYFALNYLKILKSEELNIHFTKTDQHLLYRLNSSLHLKNATFNVSIKRNLDYGFLYLEKYVRSDEGNFAFDSALSQMVPTEFGTYIRIITKEQRSEVDYKDTYTITGNVKRTNWRSSIVLSREKILSYSKNSVSLTIDHEKLSGTSFHAMLETTHLKSLENTLRNGYNRTLKLSFLTKTHLSPGLFAYAWKDQFSELERYYYGLTFKITHDNFNLKTEVSRNFTTFIKEHYFSLKNVFTLQTKKARITLDGKYSHIDPEKLPDGTYLGIILEREVKLGEFTNTININIYMQKNRKMRWRVGSNIRF